MPQDHGLLILHTGDGKGKTTAALGLALRAVGHGLRVLMIQFVKSDQATGEAAAALRLAPEFELRPMGCGFVFDEWTPEDIAAAREAWAAACAALTSGQWQMVILDELTYCLREDVLPPGEVLAALADRPAGVHVVITGRGAPEALVAAADLVTEMRPVKHPWDAGIPGQRGIEF
jgi:cob(I)alamin adenosyltransferase